jgi:uncharacterized protein involved in outer membrane biogenesis
MRQEPNMKIVKWIVGLAVVLVAVIGVGGWIALQSVDLEQVRALVQDEARKATGRELTLAGPIDLGLSWNPSIRVEKVSFANADWGSRPSMADVERFELQVAFMPLLSGDVQVKRVVLVGADVLLEKGADGAVNWSFGDGAADSSDSSGGSSGSSMTPTIESLVIEASRLTFRDAGTGQDVALAVERAEVASAGANLALDAKGKYQDAPFTIGGEVGGLAAFGSAEPFPVKLTGQVAGAEMSLDGTIADLGGTPAPNLKFHVAGADVAVFAPLTGAALPKMGPYDLAGTLGGGGSTWTVADLAAKMGGSDLAGQVTIALDGARPRVEAALTSTMLALADFGAGGEAGTTEGATTEAAPADDSPYVIPDTPLPLDALGGVDAALTVAVAKLVPAVGVEVTDVALTLALEGGVLALDPFSATYGGGKATGTLSLDGAAATPNLALAATVDDLDFGRLLKDQGVSDEVQGTMDIALDLQGQGGSPRAIASTLNGNTELIAEKGVITNKVLAIVASGLADILGPLFGGQNQITLNCMLSRFDIVDGVATSQSLLLDTSTFSLAGSGQVDLRDESLDLHFDTSSRQTALVSLAVPFNVTGTMKSPQVAPDPLGTAAAAASLAGVAVDPTAVLGALVSTTPGEGGGNGCVQVEQKAQEDSSAFGLPGLEGAAGTVQETVEGVLEGITDGDAGAAVEGAGEALEGATKGLTEGLQNLLGD